MHSIVVIKYTAHGEDNELRLWKQNGTGENSRHRQHFFCSSLANHKLIQILDKLKTMLRIFLLVIEDIALLDEGSEVQTSGRMTFRILPLASKQISPAS